MTRTPRVLTALVAGALSLGLVVGSTGTASAAPADRSARWLGSQLTKGLVHNDVYGVDDYGLTADTGIALATIGGQRKAVRQVQRALAKNVDAWTTGGTSDVYAGSVAKALVLAQTVGASPRDFGGVNLVKLLNGRVSTERGIVGRVQDKSTYGDYANTLAQAFAAGGLSRAGSPKAASAVKFLLQQQCRAGYFRLYFSDASAGARAQSCDGAARKDRAPDTDATALAIVNLQAIRKPTRKVERAIASGLRWLERQQRRNGSFGGGPTTKAPNANSTGLAAWALGQGGRCAAAQDAARWVRKLQRGNGAIAYDRAVAKSPITKESRDQWRRSTAQAAPGLRYVSGC